MQSKDYVPGASGWKLNQETGRLEINEGSVRIKAKVEMVTWAGPGQSNDQAADSIREALEDQQVATAAPFVVEAGKFFINGTQIDDAAIKSKISTDFSIRLSTAENGQSYVAGFGVGRADGGKCAAVAESALKARVTGGEKPEASELAKALEQRDAGKILDYLTTRISTTSLTESLKQQINPFHEAVRSAIREELRPGGMLNRFNR